MGTVQENPASTLTARAHVRGHGRGRAALATVGRMSQILTVLTTTDSAAAARTLAHDAVAERLAACAQINGPVTSVYRWQDEVHSDQEWQVLFKTTAERYPDLEAHLRRQHGYDVPEIIATPVVSGSEDYLAWVASETTR